MTDTTPEAARLAVAENRIAALTKALRIARRDLDNAGDYTGEARVRIALGDCSLNAWPLSVEKK